MVFLVVFGLKGNAWWYETKNMKLARKPFFQILTNHFMFMTYFCIVTHLLIGYHAIFVQNSSYEIAMLVVNSCYLPVWLSGHYINEETRFTSYLLQHNQMFDLSQWGVWKVPNSNNVFFFGLKTVIMFQSQMYTHSEWEFFFIFFFIKKLLRP